MEAILKEQEKNSVCPAKKTSIGGQALIEGIMTVSYTHLTLPTTS